MKRVLLCLLLAIVLVIPYNALAYENSNQEVADIYTDVSGEYIKTANATQEKYAIINKMVEAGDLFLCKHYSGAYMDPEGRMVIQVTCETDKSRDYLREYICLDDVEFEKVNYSYLELQNVFEAIAKKTGLLFEMKEKGVLSGEKAQLMEAFPQLQLDDKDNRITISFYLDDDSVSLEDLESYHKMIFGEYPFIRFTTRENKTSQMCSSMVRPGQPVNSCSVGYRVKRQVGNQVELGFVTCGHGNSMNAVLRDSSNTVVGYVAARSYGNNLSCDASFVKTNAGVTTSNAVYYTSSIGQTQQGTVLTGNCADPMYGQRVYKSGATTYLTSGIVNSTSFAGYIMDANGVTNFFWGLFTTSSDMVSYGDSGGVAYVLNGSVNSGNAVGIVTARGDDYTYSIFSKASKINSQLSLISY